jgi:hypothetical protein
LLQKTDLLKNAKKAATHEIIESITTVALDAEELVRFFFEQIFLRELGQVIYSCELLTL